MPPLIGLSPRLADQTFPRDPHDLITVARAIGNISKLVEKGDIRILGTNFFKMLVSDSKWDNKAGVKNQILTTLNLWFLHGRAVMVKSEIGNRGYVLHPIPLNCRTKQGLEELWADELGKLLVLHDDKVEKDEYFIGIACESAFSNESIGKYEPHKCTRFFPLVGPDKCKCSDGTSLLKNAYYHPAPDAYSQTEVSFEAAKKNLPLLGASEIRNPANGSHYKVKFPGARRSWTLDSNNDPVPEKYLRELESITGHSLDTIIYTLREGKLPKVRLKIEC